MAAYTAVPAVNAINAATSRGPEMALRNTQEVPPAASDAGTTSGIVLPAFMITSKNPLRASRGRNQIQNKTLVYDARATTDVSATPGAPSALTPMK